MGYCREFIPEYAILEIPLGLAKDKIKENGERGWTEEMGVACKEARKRLVETGGLMLPDKKKSPILRTDASDQGLGYVLAHGAEEGSCQ
ncbi:hypothetical protein NEFER03_1912 [Nematocida sp. LUAm3]|nr:hypothetical protein NEFER03_1912 [Nematocida sp. LUAm3]KAI5176444.1 hypothetical protein NEFER02_2199 [Nematocida sp. LUAm2]KAI5179322.1 hypothetical protein NEFER01_2166 [Nematocida sp. LUAm1]